MLDLAFYEEFPDGERDKGPKLRSPKSFHDAQ